MRGSAYIAIAALILAIVGVVGLAFAKTLSRADNEPWSELLLVFVLAVEGVIAVRHLEQERTNEQSVALVDAMKELGSDQNLRVKEEYGKPVHRRKFLSLANLQAT